MRWVLIFIFLLRLRSVGNVRVLQFSKHEIETVIKFISSKWIDFYAMFEVVCANKFVHSRFHFVDDFVMGQKRLKYSSFLSQNVLQMTWNLSIFFGCKKYLILMHLCLNFYTNNKSPKSHDQKISRLFLFFQHSNPRKLIKIETSKIAETYH